MSTVNFNAPDQQDLMGDILSTLFSLGYQEKNDSEFVVECLGEKTSEINALGEKFNKRVQEIANIEVKNIASPITMIVESIDPLDNYSLTLRKPSDVKTDSTDNTGNNQLWTKVNNPTIFKYLEKGDEVLVGHTNGNKSNCWIMFAKLSKDDFRKKTIYKDIDKIYDLNDNTLLLKKWMEKLVEQAFPDIEETDEEGNIISSAPDPRKLEFQNDMSNKWKDVKR